MPAERQSSSLASQTALAHVFMSTLDGVHCLGEVCALTSTKSAAIFWEDTGVKSRCGLGNTSVSSLLVSERRESDSGEKAGGLGEGDY